jgi:5-methylcytosine-specific restriction endonuclease McrA
VCYFKKTAKERLGTRREWAGLRDKLAEQDYRCVYTGMPLVLGVNDSLDHIKPAQHYPELRHDPSNVEWVTREINMMKRDRTPEEFLSLLHCIISYRESRQALTGALAPVV